MFSLFSLSLFIFLSLISQYLLLNGVMTIDGTEIKNACMAHRALVADDVRDVSAPISALFILPLLFKVIRFKFKSLAINAMFLSLVAYWGWRFFIRLMNC
ncbi:YjeO family protein [Xenorhabdus sp. 42]|nr:YjeO family protein [Xenorhabdus sp. ZM]MBD2819816.1 YjeO family protein [Xenorhabdus sp. 42]